MKIQKTLLDILHKNIDNPICKAIIDLQKSENKFINDIGYLSLAIEKPSNIAYIESQRHELFKKGCISKVWNVDLRQRLAKMSKPGKVVIRLFGEDTFDKKTVELFGRILLKDVASEDLHEFKVLDSSKIKWAYNVENYYKQESGTLGNSCMKHNNTSSYLDLYAENDLQILVKLKDGKVSGRALLWNFNYNGEEITLMDRIYVNNSSDEELFKNYAEKQGWYYKTNQAHYSKTDISYPPEYKSKTIRLHKKLNKVDFNCYPYVDTFSYICDVTKMISNDTDIFNSDDVVYVLEHADGTRQGDNRVYCQRYEMHYDNDDCVYSEWHDDYIPRNEAVEVGSDFFWEDSEYIVLDINEDYRVREDCNYSNALRAYIHSEDSVYVDSRNDYFTDEYVRYSSTYGGYVHNDDAVRVTRLNGDEDYVHIDDAIEVKDSLYYKEDVKEVDGEYFLIKEIEEKETIPYDKILTYFNQIASHTPTYTTFYNYENLSHDDIISATKFTMEDLFKSI